MSRPSCYPPPPACDDGCLICADDGPLSGPNVCEKHQKCVKVEYQNCVATVMHCSEKEIHVTSKKAVLTEVTRNVTRCCDGFYRTKMNTCEELGKTGSSHNKTGLPTQEPNKCIGIEWGPLTGAIGAGASAGFLIIFLAILVYHYRRKYYKQKADCDMKAASVTTEEFTLTPTYSDSTTASIKSWNSSNTSSGICKQNEEKTGAAVTDQVMLDLWKYDNKAISSAKSDNKAIPSEIKREMRNL